MSTVVQRIVDFNAGLLPKMVKLKYKAMAENVFGFYRGTCHLFYEDLAAKNDLPPSPPAWLCGDLHLENFGSFKGNNREVYFDLNDFDEGILAPAAWDLVRGLTSIFIAFDSLDIETAKAKEMAALFIKGYCGTLANGKSMSLDPRTATGIVCTFLTAVESRKQKDLLRKYTEEDKKKSSF